MKTSDWVRALRVVMGLIAIAASVVVLSFPGLAVFTLLFFLSFALIFLGVARIAHSVTAKFWSKGHRALHAVAGVLALILGVIVLAFPGLGIASLVFLLAFGLLAYGIVSLVIGGSGVARLLIKMGKDASRHSWGTKRHILADSARVPSHRPRNISSLACGCIPSERH